ncbi:hypothetical protein JCM8097_001961 [Rhodosporidiobolus ruineniae]
MNDDSAPPELPQYIYERAERAASADAWAQFDQKTKRLLAQWYLNCLTRDLDDHLKKIDSSLSLNSPLAHFFERLRILSVPIDADVPPCTGAATCETSNIRLLPFLSLPGNEGVPAHQGCSAPQLVWADPSLHDLMRDYSLSRLQEAIGPRWERPIRELVAEDMGPYNALERLAFTLTHTGKHTTRDVTFGIQSVLHNLLHLVSVFLPETEDLFAPTYSCTVYPNLETDSVWEVGEVKGGERQDREFVLLSLHSRQALDEEDSLLSDVDLLARRAAAGLSGTEFSELGLKTTEKDGRVVWSGPQVAYAQNHAILTSLQPDLVRVVQYLTPLASFSTFLLPLHNELNQDNAHTGGCPDTNPPLPPFALVFSHKIGFDHPAYLLSTLAPALAVVLSTPADFVERLSDALARSKHASSPPLPRRPTVSPSRTVYTAAHSGPRPPLLETTLLQPPGFLGQGRAGYVLAAATTTGLDVVLKHYQARPGAVDHEEREAERYVLLEGAFEGDQGEEVVPRFYGRFEDAIGGKVLVLERCGACLAGTFSELEEEQKYTLLRLVKRFHLVGHLKHNDLAERNVLLRSPTGEMRLVDLEDFEDALATVFS